jgi:ATP-dependent RNA helicase DeaD
VVAVYGGKPIRRQIEKLRRGAEFVVGTPGRVLDLMDRGALMLADIRFVVLDEADRMLDIGFRPDIEKILRRCPQSRQTLLLSATIPPPVMRLARRYMREPEVLNFSPTDVSVETIEQFYFTVDPERKFDLLVKLLQREDPTQAIVFCRTKRGTDKVQRRLIRKIQSVDTIHGDLPQRARDRVMQTFREGKTRILVATDVVGRGIDVTRISHIINYDIPQFCDDYVHRVGRTGRMGREGVAFTFVTPEEGNELTRVEIRINRLLKRDEIADFPAYEKPQGTAEEGQPEEEIAEPPKPKPVFGSRTRRHRRAL